MILGYCSNCVKLRAKCSDYANIVTTVSRLNAYRRVSLLSIQFCSIIKKKKMLNLTRYISFWVSLCAYPIMII